MVGSVTATGRRTIRAAAKRGYYSLFLNTGQWFTQFLNKRCYLAYLEILRLFGPGSFLWTCREGSELRRFCLFWKVISVTISRRSAAGDAAPRRKAALTRRPAALKAASASRSSHVRRHSRSSGSWHVVRAKRTASRLLVACCSRRISRSIRWPWPTRHLECASCRSADDARSRVGTQNGYVLMILASPAPKFSSPAARS